MSNSLEKLEEGIYILPKEGEMRVPGLIVASKELLESPEGEKPLEQVRNVAHLPGIIGFSIAMPDMHWGYGFPIGGVAAMDIDEGVISPGGVGYDINCGVRLALLPIKYKDLNDSIKQKILNELFHKIPSGVGREKKTRRELNDIDYKNIASKGASWAIEKGFGFEKDLDHIESRGVIDGADIFSISNQAKKRGEKQLGSLGSGNHFIEIGEIQKVFNQDVYTSWNVQQGQAYVLIHSGSRGFGHQICQDFLDSFIKEGFHKNLPDRQLVAAPIKSSHGQAYFEAMATAANFAFVNRQMILHDLREVIHKILNINEEDISLLYDVCHNIAKFEEHEVNNTLKKLCVHRKGATRAFGKNSKELAPIFKNTGQPVLVPGDMGSASYLLAGLGKKVTWCSCCHGAGRAKSRIKSSKSWRGKDLISYMKQKGTQVMATSIKTIAEEMPDAYKNVDLVVEAITSAKLADAIARLKPHLVIKG